MNAFQELEFKFEHLTFYEDRLKTFDLWSPQIQPNKFQLSSAGFYYTGKNDTVECFSCAVRLHQWGKEDDPLEEHKQHSPKCLFLKIIGLLKTNKSIESSWNPWKPSVHSDMLQNGGVHFGGCVI
jgi:hypothetical protein